MTDTLRTRIAAIHGKHLLVRYDRRAWWCQCAVIRELGLREERVGLLTRYITEWRQKDD